MNERLILDSFYKNFSDKYRISSLNVDKSGYCNQINKNAENIYKIKVEQVGIDNIKTNFHFTYKECVKLIYSNIHILPLNFLVKKSLLVSKNIKNTDKLNSDCIRYILEYEDIFISEKVIRDIINFWIHKSIIRLLQIIKDNEFDLNWYDIEVIDYKWAVNTIKKARNIIQNIKNTYYNFCITNK